MILSIFLENNSSQIPATQCRMSPASVIIAQYNGKKIKRKSSLPGTESLTVSVQDKILGEVNEVCSNSKVQKKTKDKSVSHSSTAKYLSLNRHVF